MVTLVDQLLKSALRARVARREEGKPACNRIRKAGLAAPQVWCACAFAYAFVVHVHVHVHVRVHMLNRQCPIYRRGETRLARSAGKLHVSPAMAVAVYVASAEHCCPCEKRSDPRQLSVAETKHVCTLCTVV